MAFVQFEENRFRIDGEIAENHAILVNLTASIDYSLQLELIHFFCIVSRSLATMLYYVSTERHLLKS